MSAFNCENAGKELKDGLIELAKSIYESAPCKHKWGEPTNLGTYVVQTCSKCNEIRKIA